MIHDSHTLYIQFLASYYTYWNTYRFVKTDYDHESWISWINSWRHSPFFFHGVHPSSSNFITYITSKKIILEDPEGITGDHCPGRGQCLASWRKPRLQPLIHQRRDLLEKRCLGCWKSPGRLGRILEHTPLVICLLQWLHFANEQHGHGNSWFTHKKSDYP